MNKKLLRNYDFILLLTISALALFSIVMVAASTVSGEAGLGEIVTSRFVIRQTMWVAAGLAVMVVMSVIDYSEWKRWAIPIYLVNLVLLAVVMFRGSTVYGAQRWISLGFFNLQPSEFAKVAIIVTLSVLLAREGRSLDSWVDLAVPMLHVAVPMGLIFLQPDLGTSLVFVAITVCVLFVAGLRWLHLAVLSVGGLLASIFGFLFVLEDYQKSRLIIFLDPWQDPYGVGWQIIQSQVAIGSGQFWGRGLFQGTQTQLHFLPEKHTDFIFSVIGEELGFVGGVLVLLVYLFMLLRVFSVAAEAKDNLGRYLCVGVGAMLVFQLLVNVGMTLGTMPVTGLPLPLISYGGSSFLATSMALGLVLSVAAHKDKSLF